MAADLAALAPPAGRFGLAVSGGPDSLALLLLAHAALPGRFAVATVDHGLRAAAAQECALVERVCAERGISCAVLRIAIGSGNVQAAAREARYRALGAWAQGEGLGALLTAHHADDQAETLIMRLNRASGLAGLAGVRARGTVPGMALPLLRPLLGWRRAELAAIVAAAGITPAQDPSNADDAYDRVRVRQALGAADWLDVSALAASAGHLADAEEALRHYRQMILDRHGFTDRNVAGIADPHLLPRVGQLLLVAWAFAQFDASPRGGDVARLVDRLTARQGGNLAGVLATVERGAWIFRREPPRRA